MISDREAVARGQVTAYLRATHAAAPSARVGPGEIARKVGLSVEHVIRMLGAMQRQGLVRKEKRRDFVFYRLTEDRR